MSTQDIVQAAVISLLAGLCWWQAGQDDTVLGCAWAGCLPLPATRQVSMVGSVLPRRSGDPAQDAAAWTVCAICCWHCLDSLIKIISRTRSLGGRRARNTLGLLFFLVMLLSFREPMAGFLFTTWVAWFADCLC